MTEPKARQPGATLVEYGMFFAMVAIVALVMLAVIQH